MKLRPLQIVGLVAVVVFGGYLIYTLTKPKPDPFIAPRSTPFVETAPSPAGGNLPGPAETLADTPAEPPAPIDQPLEVGSQEARDNLYCAGLLEAANPIPDQALIPAEEGRIFKARMDALSLRLTGSSMLVEEGVAADSQVDRIANAWAEIGLRDIDNGDLKISLEDCVARAEALPPG